VVIGVLFFIPEMMFACQILSFVAAIGYILAFSAGLPALRGRGVPGGNARWHRLAPAMLILGAFACQTAGMAFRGIALGRCPIDGLADVLQVVAWSLVVMYAIVGAAFRTSLLGLFTSGLAALISVGAVTAGDSASFGAVPTGILVHAWLSLFAYGAFALLALTSFMYLIQLHGLRKRRWASIFSLLPSLKELEAVNFRLLLLGTLVFTVALSFGICWYFYGYPIGVVKIVFSSILWAGYALALSLRFGKVLFGKRLAAVCVALFVFAMITLYPVAERHMAARPETDAEEEVR
jgi:HemX protein